MSRLTTLQPLPAAVADELREKFQRMLARLEDVRTGSAAVELPGIWSPAIDLGEQEDQVLIRVELPGVRPDQVKLSLSGKVLRIEGRKERLDPGGSAGKPLRFLCLERSYGGFAFTLSLGWQIEPEGITARMSDGILDIRLPKRGQNEDEIIIPIGF
ncbi:MAG: Hsp20/alpha crystallin family protein [Acidobacteria bacterium]|nr:Hsp20/alpha crystallin family protein [Acidobacteriota bacterium]